MSRRPLAWLALVAVLVNGCAASRGHQSDASPISDHRPGTCGGRGHAPRAGDYVLLQGGEERPLLKRSLKADDPVGFEQQSGGRLYAVAGGDLIPLEEGDYRWIRQPDPGRWGASLS